MKYDVPKIIEFLELFKEVAKPANSIYRWQELIRVLPIVTITSYKVTEPFSNDVESVSFLITDKTPGAEKGYRYTVHIKEGA